MGNMFERPKMATCHGNGNLSDDQIEKLSHVIEMTGMQTIAISYFKIQGETVANLKTDHQRNATGFNRAVLTMWKRMNPGDNQVQNLADLLYKSATKHACVDPHKVTEILGVSNTSGAADETISEEEFLSIAEMLKPYIEEKMKIEPYAWYPVHSINMDKLYTELTLEKIEREVLGEKTWTLQTYEDMFSCNKSEHKNRKILMKADPGMGKTTLLKKVTRDWATGVFTKFSIVFFVALKLVKPGNPIESVIMQQSLELEGLEGLDVSQQKLKALLDRFSNRVLIILDGLDEHGPEQNDDVLKIIKGQKLQGCTIVVSSRPHSANEVQKHFRTIIRVEGFTKTEATKFVSNFFTDKKDKEIAQILQFKPSDSREDFPVHKCPILLSFLCLLVKENKIDLSDTKLTVGDLYLRMVRCLYKKFTVRKDMQFVQSEFVRVMKSVGILALKTLLSNNPLLQESEVIEIMGKFAFEYGFFAGDEDFRLCTDPTADICVTYAHRSIEEFFGSFGFLQALDDGKSIDDILGSDCEKPIFMVNPLVLRFCLWLLTTEYFSSRSIDYDKLVAYAAQRIDFYMLNTYVVGRIYPAMNIKKAVQNKDSLKLEFFKQVFEKCEQVRVLHVLEYYDIRGYIFNEMVEGILGLISHSMLNKLSQLAIADYPFLPAAVPCVNDNALTILIRIQEPHSRGEQILKIPVWLIKHSDLKRAPQMCASIESYSLDLKDLVQEHMKQLCVSGCRSGVIAVGCVIDPGATLSVSGEFPFCPHFTHFSAYGYQVEDSVPAAFMKAVKEGKFPNLRRIELNGCTMSDCEWPEVPEFSCGFRTDTTYDLSQMQKLLLKLTELTVYENVVIEKPLHIDQLIHVRLEKLTVLKLELAKLTKLQCLNDVLKRGLLPNLSELLVAGPSDREIRDTFLEEQRFTISAEELKTLSEKLTSLRLTKLDLTHSSGFTGDLSVLFTHSFLSLDTLILRSCRLNGNDVQSLGRANVEGKLPELRHLSISDNCDVEINDLFTHIFPRLDTLILAGCKLNSNDLQSLARANVEGKFPQLRHLDISHNNDNKISELFTHSAQWNQLKILTTSDFTVQNVEPQFLTSLEELLLLWPLGLRLEEIEIPSVTRCWSGLKIIQLEIDKGIPCIADGVKRGMFPALNTVKCYRYGAIPYELSLFKLLKANIVLHIHN